MFRKFFSRKKTLDDAVKLGIAEAIAAQLMLQKNTAGADAAIDDKNGHPKLRALGYVYGYIDAALRTDGHDIADTSIGGMYSGGFGLIVSMIACGHCLVIFATTNR